jgi:hypothetical protein
VNRGRWVRAAAASRIALLLLFASLPALDAAAQPTEGGGPNRGSSEGGLDDFVVPGLPKGLLRLEVGSGYAPSANAGGSEVSVATPGVRLRLQGPISERVGAQAFFGAGTTLYDIKDSSDLFADCNDEAGMPLECPAPDEFYAASFGAQVAYLLNPNSYMLFDGERWALVGEAFIRARWERGAFDRSLKAGTIYALGYELTKYLRVAVGAQVDVALDGGNVSVQPTAAFRWDITPTLRLGNRGYGLQLEYREFKRFEFFVAGYRSSDSYRLHDRDGFPSGAEFDDRRWQVGGGVEWKLARWLRLTTEAGAIVDRQLSVSANGEGRLSDEDVDKSPYLDVRLEFRP